MSDWAFGAISRRHYWVLLIFVFHALYPSAGTYLTYNGLNIYYLAGGSNLFWVYTLKKG